MVGILRTYMYLKKKKMDVLKALSAYVNRIINHRAVNGMRVLIVDSHTTQVISMTTSMSDILASNGRQLLTLLIDCR